MIETPEAYNARPPGPRYPADDLARYRFHTGADLRAIGREEPCPILFRDLGPLALNRFLRGELRRLAGPYTPLTYLRSASYVEPYTDFEAIGRLVFLRPLLLQPWRSGIPHVYVARASRTADAGVLGFVPGSLGLDAAALRLADVTCASEMREALGGRHHDAEVAETRHRLDRLAAELVETEFRAEPLRNALQSGDRVRRDRARETMRTAGLSEDDLCAAWHHLPRDRRAAIREALRSLVGQECQP